MIRRPSWRFRSGQEALPKVREWSGGPPGGLGVVGRPFWRSVGGRKALREVQEWLGGPLGGMNWSEGPPKGP